LNKKRAVILNTAIVFGFFAIFLRLTSLMILDHKALADKAKLQQIKAEDIHATRGNIFDRKGRELAVNVELESLYCDVKEVDIDKEKMTKLSTALGVEPKVIQAKFQPNKRFTWINRKLTPETTRRVRAVLGIGQKPRSSTLTGFGFVPEAKRFYPKGMLASHVIGTVGLDNQPLEGVELKYDKYLKTSGGKVYFERDASGKMLSSGVDMEAKGNDLLLTLDEDSSI
jgi:cell division protein FtsI/penicillin-binding protein 2